MGSCFLACLRISSCTQAGTVHGPHAQEGALRAWNAAAAGLLGSMWRTVALMQALLVHRYMPALPPLALLCMNAPDHRLADLAALTYQKVRMHTGSQAMHLIPACNTVPTPPENAPHNRSARGAPARSGSGAGRWGRGSSRAPSPRRSTPSSWGPRTAWRVSPPPPGPCTDPDTELFSPQINLKFCRDESTPNALYCLPACEQSTDEAH